MIDRRKAWRLRNPEKVREIGKLYARKRRQTHKLNYLLSGAKARALAKGLEFSITLDDLSIPDVCPVFGHLISAGVEKRSDSSPSIDRIDPKKGYVPGNVRVISWRANRLKSDMSLEECRLILKDLKAKS